MLTKEFVQILKELTNTYESLCQGGGAHTELLLWRNKYLSSIPQSDDPEKDTWVKNAFLSVHCDNFKFISPDDLLKKIQENYKKDENKPS